MVASPNSFCAGRLLRRILGKKIGARWPWRRSPRIPQNDKASFAKSGKLDDPMDTQTKAPFPLTRVFALVSLAVTAAATLLVTNLISSQEKKVLIEEGQQYAIRVAEHLNRSLGRDFSPLRSSSSWILELQDQERYARLDALVRDSTGAFGVDRIVLFDPDGVIRYCTDPVFVGHRPNEEDSFDAVQRGQTVTHLALKGEDSDLDGTPHKRNLLETYYPLRFSSSPDASQAEIAGILEIYQDASPLFSEIRRAERRVAWIVILTMGGLFSILLMLVVRADRTILAQHRELREQRDRMEETVQSRTTELFEVQDRLIEASRRATLGTMAAGIAHEINNPLGSMAACAEGLLQRAKEASFRDSEEFRDFPDYLEIIRREAYRCKDVTSRLLDLTRSAPLKKQWFRLDPMLRDLRLLISHRPKSTLKNLQIDAADGTVYGDPNGIKQVLLNLLQNAFDAVQDRADAKVVLQSKIESDRWTLTVTDNGEGFEPEAGQRLFDPFFTSKSAGRGTGLGLAVSRAIVQRHGGEIRAQSQGPGMGASFVLVLPLREDNHER